MSLTVFMYRRLGLIDFAALSVDVHMLLVQADTGELNVTNVAAHACNTISLALATHVLSADGIF